MRTLVESILSSNGAGLTESQMVVLELADEISKFMASNNRLPLAKISTDIRNTTPTICCRYGYREDAYCKPNLRQDLHNLEIYI